MSSSLIDEQIIDQINIPQKKEIEEPKNNLVNLIDRLYDGYKMNSKYVSVITDIRGLIEGLVELNSLIGNEEVKTQTAKQISFLIASKHREKETGNRDKDTMLNTILQGPPGVGKTLIGTKLAKIWLALGYLNGKKNPKSKSPLKRVFQENDLQGVDYATYFLIFYIIIIIISSLVAFMMSFWGYASSFYNYIGFKWFMGLIIFLIILIGISIFAYMLYSYDSQSDYKKEQNETIGGVNKSEFKKNPNDIITIVGREDLVDQYVGWSAKKTKKVLMENLGKVLFIDEAYAIVNGPQDEFGFEVLNTLNKFLSEHADEIIVVLGGYKNKLQNNLFSFQPGFARRFMWHFDCPGYTPKELFRIFRFQVINSGWKLNDEKNIESIIINNNDAFPNFGGDTNRLCFLCKMEHSDDYLTNHKKMETNAITADQVIRGIKVLRKNNLQPGQVTELDPMMSAMKLMNQFK